MTKSLFRQSFLTDTLDVHIDVAPAEQVLSNGVQLKLYQRGVLEAIPENPTQETKNIIISCGIHGDETAPMELVDSIIKDIESGFQKVDARCLFIIAHPESTLAHTRFLEENLNRLFDEKEHEPTKELAIADTLKLLVRDFYQDTDPKTRWHLDLHCAIRGSKHYTFAVSPKTRHPVRSKALVDFLDSAHIEAVLLSNSPSSTFSWYSAENYGAQALTMELGRVARIGENALDRLTAFDLALRNLIAEAQPEHLSKPCIKYRVSRTIVRLHDDFDFMFDDNVENFTSFVHGEVFGHDGDKPLMAKNDNEAIVFPNRHVAIGQRAALMVCEVKTRFEEGELVYD
ncbi:succinylglutamate desuccinylase [Vibrio parahaemolyticus]|uniref:succinylglutamate desuccinylase n=1 Tax=Vibrio parahaemolyticus TaxID=670 RepID=UPI00084BA14A|nr:succinylglutamate desuccinylase [Vibrio parahaemolyticus]EJD0681937.1 succinylglutamate desuccinylase [Vibrio parahaemolyticus]EJI6218042.1 succinylglutamate desuccinylase [Vibrio parahaemolyticus]OEA47020.1 succinylglutamate desuccinylase [Vibrio parahaemolyticus]TOL80643.1 succinylglutamate desuccinylase [Vibrio parahaemolyticus]HCM1568642.1 succinylglutamate desuccinylase [Vibrio parahaemolyticus]